MKLHPRHVPVELAKRELDAFVAALSDRHSLTRAEELSLLAELLAHKLYQDVKEGTR